MATHQAKYMETIYISEDNSKYSVTNEYPDFADYPYNTVPNKVE